MMMFEGTWRSSNQHASHRLCIFKPTHLHQNVSDIENTQASGVLRVAELQVLLQTSQSSCSHVVAVQIVHDVDQDEQRTSCIELPLHRFLDNLSTFRVHGRVCIAKSLNRRLLGVDKVAAILLDVVGHGCTQSKDKEES